MKPEKVKERAHGKRASQKKVVYKKYLRDSKRKVWREPGMSKLELTLQRGKLTEWVSWATKGEKRAGEPETRLGGKTEAL